MKRRYSIDFLLWKLPLKLELFILDLFLLYYYSDIRVGYPRILTYVLLTVSLVL